MIDSWTWHSLTLHYSKWTHHRRFLFIALLFTPKKSFLLSFMSDPHITLLQQLKMKTWNTTGVKSRKIILYHFNIFIKGRNYTLHIIKDFLFSIIELYLKDCKMKQEQNVLWSINYKLNCIIEYICWWNMEKKII